MGQISYSKKRVYTSQSLGNLTRPEGIETFVPAQNVVKRAANEDLIVNGDRNIGNEVKLRSTDLSAALENMRTAAIVDTMVSELIEIRKVPKDHESERTRSLLIKSYLALHPGRQTASNDETFDVGRSQEDLKKNETTKGWKKMEMEHHMHIITRPGSIQNSEAFSIENKTTKTPTMGVVLRPRKIMPSPSRPLSELKDQPIPEEVIATDNLASENILTRNTESNLEVSIPTVELSNTTSENIGNIGEVTKETIKAPSLDSTEITIPKDIPAEQPVSQTPNIIGIKNEEEEKSNTFTPINFSTKVPNGPSASKSNPFVIRSTSALAPVAAEDIKVTNENIEPSEPLTARIENHGDLRHTMVNNLLSLWGSKDPNLFYTADRRNLSDRPTIDSTPSPESFRRIPDWYINLEEGPANLVKDLKKS